MRFILILLVALSLTLAWQSTMLASQRASVEVVCSDNNTGQDSQSDKKKQAGDEEPECD